MAALTATRPCGKVDAQGRIIPESFSDLTFRGEYTGTNLVYKGFARPGASESALVWQIAILAYDGSSNLLSIKWPEDDFGNPSTEYIFSWTDRASYTYN
jgi:hypothetical protein